MNEMISVLDVIKQMTIDIPSVITGTVVLTGMINAACNVQNNNVKHAISWVVAVVAALTMCWADAMDFGLGNWNYAVAAGVGLVAGGASNGLYDWPAIKNIIDKFYDLFGKK